MSTVISTEEFGGVETSPMLFILGKERSGTTLLQTLLDTHPNIVGPPESKFVLLLYPRFGNIKSGGRKRNIKFYPKSFTKSPGFLLFGEPKQGITYL